MSWVLYSYSKNYYQYYMTRLQIRVFKNLHQLTNKYSLSGEWMLFPFTFYDLRWSNYFYMKHLTSQITSDPSLSEASVQDWKTFLTQLENKDSSLCLNPGLSSCLWEKSMEFQGKAIQSHKECMRGWMKAGWMEKRKRTRERKSKVGWEMSGDFYVLQNQFVPVYLFSSSSH